MNTRAIQLATGLLALGFVLIGPSCGSIPEGRNYLPAGYDAGDDSGGSTGAGGRGTGGRNTGGRNTGGGNVAGSGSGGVNPGGGSGTGGFVGAGGGGGVCAPQEGVCDRNDDCCAVPRGASCVTFAGQTEGSCTAYCTLNSQCPTNCCVILTNGKGSCAHDATACPASCRSLDDTCDDDAMCCSGYVCAEQYPQGPKLCRPPCTTDADCAPDVCVRDALGSQGSCARAEVGLCTNTCTYAPDGACDDGGANSEYSLCTLGTDCADCGPRIGGNSLCDDSCGRSNGLCEDGGSGSNGATCFFGEDCSDCGPRSSICVDTCFSANDGRCDYDLGCDPGTDCTDCGPFYGGRGENPCDGSFATKCTPYGSGRDFAGTCDCDDCAWDQADCGTPNMCNGSTVSACCGATNSCGIGNDGVCDCGGWCTWEGQDCGGDSPVTPACDPATFAGCDTCLRTVCPTELSACSQFNCTPLYECLRCCASTNPDATVCPAQCGADVTAPDTSVALDLLLCSVNCGACLGAVPVPAGP